MRIKKGVGLFFDDMIREEKGVQRDGPTETDYTCLKIAIARFLDSGRKDDAFDVYFCFSEIFKMFGSGYGGAKEILNLLADHEMTAGSLLAKHRDHYSHSAYVFAMGIALFQKNEKIREQYNEEAYGNSRYGRLQEFLYRWGTASLFHDIGYPFEIASESIMEYGRGVFGNRPYPMISYTGIDDVIKLSDDDKAWLQLLLGPKEDVPETIHDVLLPTLKKITKRTPDEINKMLKDVSGSVMHVDHGYYSALLMMKAFIKSKSGDDVDLKVMSEAAAAALMHGGFYKYGFGKGKKLDVESGVISFMLMLCDDLQTFDRQGYGRSSKSEPLPRDCFIDTWDSCEKLSFAYAYPDSAIDYSEKGNVKGKKRSGTKDPDDNYISNKMRKLEEELDEFYDLNSIGGLSVTAEINNVRIKNRMHNSASYFKNIFGIAMEIHSNYLEAKYYNKITEEWDKLSLEYKMSNILQAKSYADKLNTIHCFYDDRKLMLESVTVLAPNEIEELARIEHDRWFKEKSEMGWSYADYEDASPETFKRMRAERKHNCLVKYDMLSRNDQEKDIATIENMIPNLNETGFVVYRASERKKKLEEERIGLVCFDRCEDVSLEEIIAKMERRSNKGKRNLLICRHSEFDMKVAEKALESDIYVKIVIPMGTPFEIRSPLLRNEERVKVLEVPKLDKDHEDTIMKYIAANSDTVLTVGVHPDPEERVGFASILLMAKRYGQNIINLDPGKDMAT